MSLYVIDRLAQVLADGSSDAVTVFGITLVGVSVTTAVKLMFTVGLVVVVLGFTVAGLIRHAPGAGWGGR